MKVLICILILVTSLKIHLFGQHNQLYKEKESITDSTNMSLNLQDSLQEDQNRWSPRKASLYAAILPGLGQIYNKSYWKLPIVYGGLVALSLTSNYYHIQHQRYRKELFELLKDDEYSPPSRFNENQLRSVITKTRRERDYFMILTGLFYLLQIVESHVDAHLKAFKINPDLKVSIEPSILKNEYTNLPFVPQLSFKLFF